jgi:hypothetical protein
MEGHRADELGKAVPSMRYSGLSWQAPDMHASKVVEASLRQYRCPRILVSRKMFITIGMC